MTHQQVIELPPAPRAPNRQGTSIGTIVLPIAAGSGSLLVTVTNQGRPLVAAIGLLVLVASIGMGVLLVVSARTGARRTLNEQRERYLDHLDGVRGQLADAERSELARAVAEDPPPTALVEEARHAAAAWRRAPPEPVGAVRVGVASVPAAVTARRGAAGHGIEHVEDAACVEAADELIRRFRTAAEHPVRVSLPVGGRLEVRGPAEHVRAFARALLCRLAVRHGPDELRLAIDCDPELAASWAWAGWLPHLGGSSATQAVDDARRFVVVDGAGRAEGRRGATGARVLCLVTDGLITDDPIPDRLITDRLMPDGLMPDGAGEGRDADVIITCADRNDDAGGPAHRDLLRTRGASDDLEMPFCADQLDLATARCVARILTRHGNDYGHQSGRRRAVAAPSSLPEALGITPLTRWDPLLRWRSRPDTDLLRVPIGMSADGATITLDLKESARGGMGPHGLLVGATGTGKSELLRAVVLGLAVTHQPDELAFLLVDYKGGAAFAPLADLPQVAGIVTNLADDDGLLDRVAAALRGEVARRQRLLAGAGNVPDIDGYRRLRHLPHGGDRSVEPMPRLLVIVDECTELVIARPDLLDVFTAIGRIGRSLGVHLLIASQRLDAGRVRGLETHLSYRIALRTFSELESREAIGRPDAFALPDRPGAALLSVAGRLGPPFRVFPIAPQPVAVPSTGRSVQGGASHAPPVVVALPGDRAVTNRVLQLRSRRPVAPAARPSGTVVPSGSRPDDGSGGVVAEAARRIRQATVEAGQAAAQPIWLDPLPERLSLTDVLRADAAATPPPCRGPICVPIGLVDEPEHQRQPPLHFEPSAGPLLVVGATRTGRSTAAAAIVAAVTARHPPGRVTVLAVDCGGGLLCAFTDLPHVAVVAPRSDPELVRRTVRELHRILTTRDQAGAAADGDTVLVIDGWSAARQIDESLDDVLADLLARGSGLRVHAVVTAGSPADLRSRLASAFPARIELRLADPFESSIDRMQARRLPTRAPGRALVAGGRIAQIAVPPTAREAISALCDRWAHPPVPRVRTLPDRVALDRIDASAPAGAVVLGIAEHDHTPVWLDLAADPLVLIAGDPGSGRTAVLRAILKQLRGSAAAPGPSVGESGIAVVDLRRGLGSVDATIARDPAGTAALCAAIAGRCAERLVAVSRTDAAHPTALVLVIDDYELVAGSAHPLLPYLPHARDIGLRVVLARSCGGLARARYEPVLQAFCDLGAPLLLLSGDPAEGRLQYGMTPRPLPPGRGRLGRRGRPELTIQTPWIDP